MTRCACLILLALFMPRAFAVVDMRNANFNNTWEDFRLQTVGAGGKLTLSRTYNSRTLFNGIFGFGWCTNIEDTLEMTAEGNLKYRDCGAGSEVVFFGSPLTRKEVESTIDAIIEKMKAEATTYQDAKYYKERRDELLEYDDTRNELARKAGLLKKPVEGRRYVAETGRPPEFTENGKRIGCNPAKPSEIVFRDGLFRLTRSDGSQKYFDRPGLNRKGRLVRLVDQEKHALKIRYFDNGLPESVSDENGQWLKFEYYTANHKVRRISASDGSKSEYRYQNHDDLTYSIDPKLAVHTYSYNDLHNITKIDGPKGSTTRLRYNDENDWVTEFRDRDSCVEKYDYKIDPKDSKGHFWSTVTKSCGAKVTARFRCEFKHARDETGEFVAAKMERIDESMTSRPVNALGHTGSTTESACWCLECWCEN